MLLNQLLNDVYSAFSYHTANARLVLMHAQSRYRTLVVSQLMADPNYRVLYYALDVDDCDIPNFLAGIAQQISEQTPIFGAQLSHANMINRRDPAAQAAAFAADIAEICPGPFYLLLDEYDRARISDELQIFLERLIDYLPAHGQILICGRNLPRMPWMALVAKGQAIMLRDTELIVRNFHENQGQPDSRIHLSGFSNGIVSLDGSMLTVWEGHLPRLLFFFAMERPYVTRSEICQAFWPDLTADQAINVFHVTKRRLHKALVGIKTDTLIHTDGFYYINPEVEVYYDVVDFVEALVEARLQPELKDKVAAWERAVALHSHSFLYAQQDVWAINRRHDYQVGYIEALAGLAQTRLDEQMPEQALALYQKALAEDAYRQDLHRNIMNIYSMLGRRSEMVGHYQRMETGLKTKKQPVEAETIKLFNDLRHQ
jgi:DNA-binding SARP family transcriptional activator